jgi:superfamily II DNA helicase RecQ
MEHLQLMEDNTDVIFKSPDRPNIFLEIVKKESTEYETCLSWLIEHIRVKGSNSKKTIIYCRSIDAVSEMFCTLHNDQNPASMTQGFWGIQCA